MPDPQELLIEIEDEQNLEIELDDEHDMAIELDYDVVELGHTMVHFDTVDHWNEQKDYISEKGNIYVYVDYQQIDGNNVPGFKMGDGLAYLIDLPFMSGNATKIDGHILNEAIHITESERAFWNNKVTCYVSPVDPERLIFSKAKEE